jgi:hypothetical protein
VLDESLIEPAQFDEKARPGTEPRACDESHAAIDNPVVNATGIVNRVHDRERGVRHIGVAQFVRCAESIAWAAACTTRGPAISTRNS